MGDDYEERARAFYAEGLPDAVTAAERGLEPASTAEELGDGALVVGLRNRSSDNAL